MLKADLDELLRGEQVRCLLHVASSEECTRAIRLREYCLAMPGQCRATLGQCHATLGQCHAGPVPCRAELSGRAGMARHEALLAAVRR